MSQHYLVKRSGTHSGLMRVFCTSLFTVNSPCAGSEFKTRAEACLHQGHDNDLDNRASVWETSGRGLRSEDVATAHL